MTDEINAILSRVLRQGRNSLSEHEAKEVLKAYGIPTTQEMLVQSIDELVSALGLGLRSFQFPVVLKIDSPDILHKTEAGLVKLNCQNADEAALAFDDLMRRARERFPEARINGALVQEMVTDCTECIVGMKIDPQFGPVIMFGLGGIFVEVFEDIILRVAPLTKTDAEQMVRGIKGFKVLDGARGRPKADIAAIEEALIRMSNLAMDLKDYVTEIDINPLMIGTEGNGVKAVDALMVLSATTVPRS